MSASTLITLLIVDILAIIIIALIIRGLWEPRHTIIDYAELHAPIGKSRDFVARPIFMHSEDIDGIDKYDLRVLYFSDLHAEYCRYDVGLFEKLIEKEAKGRGLDAVIFGGDIVNDPLNAEVGTEYLSRIAAVCLTNNIPFYGVTGNHDVMIPKDRIDACGFTDLRDKYVTLKSRKGEGVIALTGVYDTGRENRVWYAPASVPTELEDGTRVLANVLLAHNPDYILHLDQLYHDGAIVDPKTVEYDTAAVEEARARAANNYRSCKVTHVLSGHIHGGQIRTPIGIEFSVLRKDILPKKQKVIAGVYEGCGVSLFLSRGLGNILLPLRIFSRPEITIVEIYA